MADNEIVYEIKADPKSAQSAIKSIDASAKESADASGGIGGLSGAIGRIGPAAIAAGAAIATYLVAQGLREGISAAIETEGAIARMNAALGNAGRLSAESSQDLQNFAGFIQNTTTVSDDATLSLLSLATAFTQTNEQSKKLVQAAVDLSSAMGVSVETAVRQLGGSLNGMVGTLGKVVPEVRNLTEAQLRSGMALDLVSQKFAGAGAAAANTFGGKITQLKNTFGDFLEEIGFFFTKSDSLRKAFSYVAEGVKALTQRFAIFREGTGDIFQPILLGIGYVAKGIVFTLGPAFEAMYNFIQVTGRGIAQLGAIMEAVFTGNFVGAAALAKQAFDEGFNMKDLLNMKGTESAMAYVDGFISQIQLSNGLIQESLPAEMQGGASVNLGPTDEEKEKVVEDLSMIGMAYSAFANRIQMSQAAIKKNWDELKKGLFTTFVQGMGKAMNAFGQALVTGENVLGAFGKAVLGMLGELAMQLGMFFFLEGIGYFASGDYARGAALMAGGLALMAFGGVLQALSGGGGSSAASSTSAASAGGGATSTSGAVGDSSVGQGDVAERERTTTIEVNIAGNVLGDKRTLGLEIADALNEAFGNDGIIIARGAIS